MVQERPDDHNKLLDQAKDPVFGEAFGAGAGREPYPNEVIGRKEPPYHPIGVDALSPLLLHAVYPASKQELIEAIGHARIAISQDRTKSVADILAQTAPETFASSKEVEDAVKHLWDKIAEREGAGGRHWQRSDTTGRPRR